MRQVNIREARRQLSGLVDAAERGESTLIVRRGQAVARLDPVEPEARPALPNLSHFRNSIRVKGKSLSTVVIEQRRKARY